ncbi:RecX family transcriptional regulator [Oceanispirochaeta sp.]|jgi:regulatory protein|uniref:regulatory protein RecX n=1 Tax=Oceanispirochaeta sp. TaxID=2035350 RepID=UPI0026034E2B|nr:RecX family transcriptional regulator [Oceanispirochaeta sp.]MDA3957626.1 RecX family transcriptional regulator [Oceanispirochaeta sp.]
MDRKGLVVSSSSLNVNISIASLQKRGAGKETITVSLTDGSSFFMPLPLDASWVAGKILSDEDLERLIEEDSYVRGKEWAASRLALREDSSGRMMQKLQKRGYSSLVSRRILSDMIALGFLDDYRFSELWLHERLKIHPEGRDALVAGLQHRGVSGDIARTQVVRLITDEDEQKALQQCYNKLKRQSLSDEKIIKNLLRRGFPYSSIKNKVRRDYFDPS